MNYVNLVAKSTQWKRLKKVVVPRGPAGSFDSGIVGDPCIVWDADIENWRMFYFAVGEDFVGTGVALARSPNHVDGGDWIKAGRLPIEGPLAENSHKFWVLMDPCHPGKAVRLEGKYVGFFTTYRDGAKVVVRAHAGHLSGPWWTDEEAVLPAGTAEAFDGLGADAPTAYWFSERAMILLFYMAYPAQPQQEQPRSPLGPCQAAAILDPGVAQAEKLGPILRPGSAPGGWCSGWFGGLQLLPAPNDQWIALLNGSATVVHGGHGEPDPSVGGWARCTEEFPVTGWTPDGKQSPIELPPPASAAAQEGGENTNFWRHYLFVLPDERARIYYNSGTYGTEQIYVRLWQP